jgi:hypothetical protein
MPVAYGSKSSFGMINWEKYFGIIKKNSSKIVRYTDRELAERCGMDFRTCASAVTQMRDAGLLFQMYNGKLDPTTGRFVRQTRLSPDLEIPPEEKQIDFLSDAEEDSND